MKAMRTVQAGMMLGLALLGLAGCSTMGNGGSSDMHLKVNDNYLELVKLKTAQDDGFRKVQYNLDQLKQQLEAQEETLKALREDQKQQMAALRREMRSGRQSSTVAVPSGDMAKKSESELLREAMEQYSLGQYDKAIPLFQQYLADFKDSLNAPDAASRLAKCYYERQEFGKAIETFQFFLSEYPANPRVPQVMHSLALCQIQDGAKDNARKTLEDLRVQFPTYEPDLIQKLLARVDG